MIDAPLEQLAALGLARPEHLTVDQYLRVLVEQGLLNLPLVETYLEAFQAARYSGEALPLEQAAQAVEALQSEVDLLGDLAPERLHRARSRLQPAVAPAPMAAPAPRPTAPDLAAQIPTIVPSAPEPLLPPPPARTGWHSLPSPRVVIPVLLVLMLWSGVMIAFGYSRAGRIEELVQWVKRRGRPKPQPPPQQLTPIQRMEKVRILAGAAPGDRGLWLRYAMMAHALHQYADAIVGFQHLLRRWGEDPTWKQRAMVLNNLAWLHLTAIYPYARDQLKGLELAERAYALNQAPYITDTLAEACFQNGQLERAVKLERQALKGAKEKGRGAFRRSLERYEDALMKLVAGERGPDAGAAAK